MKVDIYVIGPRLWEAHAYFVDVHVRDAAPSVMIAGIWLCGWGVSVPIPTRSGHSVRPLDEAVLGVWLRRGHDD
jgi:hypothetical protein